MEPINKILVFGKNGCLVSKSVIPNHRIFGMTQSKVFQMLGLVTFCY